MTTLSELVAKETKWTPLEEAVCILASSNRVEAEQAASELAAMRAELEFLTTEVRALQANLRDMVIVRNELVAERDALRAVAREMVTELKNNWAIDLLVDEQKYEDTTLSGRVMKNLAALVQP